MKIVYCIQALYNSGGMERVLTCKANYLVALGHEVHIITTDQMMRPIFFPLDKRVSTYDLGINYEVTNGGGVWQKVKGHWGRQRRHRIGLERLLYEIRPDVTVAMFGNDEGIIPRIKDGSRKVLECHFSKPRRLQYARTGLWHYIDRWRTWQDGRAAVKFDKFVVLTQEDKALWGDLPNITVIPNPLPFVSEDVATLSDKRVIAAGRYTYQKNFEALIRIWSRISREFPDWRLDIYGEGPLRPKLEGMVESLGLSESLSLCKPTLDMPREYLHSSVYAMTSNYEGLPMVLLEAQTMGLPIVSYACQCGPRDIITDGVDGYLVDMHDEDAFAERLARLMSDTDERYRMGASAKQASSRYEIDQIMAQWLDLFSSWVGTNG